MIHRRSFLTRVMWALAVFSVDGFRQWARAENLRSLFNTSPFETTLNTLLADASVLDTDRIGIDMPDNAENGAAVPITLHTNLDGVDTLYLWAEKNPTPLVAAFDVTPDVLPYITTRIKLAESGRVIVLAKQGQQWFRQQRWIDVMRGGCGTG